MPKGQDKTAKMPDDLDAPAILSLLKYCSWFTKDLPNAQILSDLIDIRSKVFHSGVLRVADSDKDSWIDLMIQLLKDLKIHGDVQAELELLKKEDIDINFRETEVRVLQKMVSGLVSDLTVMKVDMNSLHKSQSDLSEDMEQVRDSTTETTEKVETVEADIEGMRKSVEELKIIYDKMVSFLDKNPGILDQDITKTIRVIAMDVKDLQSNLSRVEMELKARVSSLEKHREETSVQIKGVERRVEGIEGTVEKNKKQIEEINRRVAAVEEQKKNDEQSETRKKRPESDDLKKLKYQTEDRLDTQKKLEIIPTKQAEEAKKLLAEKKSIVIKGNPGEGKTTISLHLIDNEMFRDKCVVLNKPRQWDNVDTDCVDIVVLEDIFGKYDFDPACLEEWKEPLSTIQDHVDAGKLQVIVTTRADVLSKAYSKLELLKLFSEELTLTLSSEQLTNPEKMNILNRELNRHKRNLKEDEKEVCIANFDGLIGFPQCCSLFAGDSKSFDKGPEFFRSPTKFFLANITKLEATRFLSLAFLFCNGEILEENLSSETMAESSKQLLMELASNLNISKKQASITLLRDAYDNVLDLYIVKSMSNDFSLESVVKKPCIRFAHATVSEAVGHVFWNRCLEMIVKYGDSEYLYQRTYTAKVKDGTSENMFIPVYAYGVLAERIVHDVVKKELISSVVKHSALKNHDFLMKLKDELHKSKMMKDFFMAGYGYLNATCLLGECQTFMQLILQSDEDVASLVYDGLLEFFECDHNYVISDCWKCTEKQNLLQLALYYHHFQIADKLITMNASYTQESLCNAARHGDLQRVMTIMETLKEKQVFNPKCEEAKVALCRAYISGNQKLAEILLKEKIILDTRQVVEVVQHGDINGLKKMVEHLRYHDKWKPDRKQQCITKMYSICFDLYYSLLSDIGHHFTKPDFIIRQYPWFAALFITYLNEKFDMADYLIKNEINVEMCMLVGLLNFSSQPAAFRAIQDLKHTGTWDPNCDNASEALGIALYRKMYDVYDLLVQYGVSLKMENLPGVIKESKIPLEFVKKAIQHMKDTDNWDPKRGDASKALEFAFCEQKYDVYDLLVQYGVSLKMENLPGVIMTSEISLEYVKKAIQHLKDTDNWDPKRGDASKALEVAICEQKYDVYDLLVQYGVSLKMENLPDVIMTSEISLEYVKKAIQHMKDTDNWDPKCDDASEALEVAICEQKYDVYDLLVQDGVSLKMENLPCVIRKSDEISLEYVKKAIQHMKDTDSWDPKCYDASEALNFAICEQKYDVYDLLVEDGVSLKMKDLPGVKREFMVSLEYVKKAIQHMKDTDNWDPKCYDASEAFEIAICEQKYDVYDLLVEDGVSLKMENLLGVIRTSKISLEYVKKAIQHMKDTDNWDPKCYDASKALEIAICEQKYDVYDLLVEDGVSLKMENLLGVIMTSKISLEYVKKAIQHMKDTENWDPMCGDATNALKFAICEQKYDVCDLLVQCGVSLQINTFPYVIGEFKIPLESFKKAIQHMKDTNHWDPKCDDASYALKTALCKQKYDVYDLLVQYGVSLKMENLPGVIRESEIPFESLKKAIQHMKDTDNWDPKCGDATNALGIAICEQKYDVSDLLVQEGVSLKMENLLGVIRTSKESLESVKKAIQHMKDTDNWDPKCGDAFEALNFAICEQKYDVYDLLVQYGVSLKMENLPGVIRTSKISLEYVKKAIQHMKDTDNWDPKCDDASEALETAICQQKFNVSELLVQDGKAIQHMKDNGTWDHKCYDAYEALKTAIFKQKYDVSELLVQYGVLLKMENLPGIIRGYMVSFVSLEYVKKAIQHMKDTDNWDPTCDVASEALKTALCNLKYDLYDLLVQDGVSLKMKNLPGVMGGFMIPLNSFKKAIQHLKDNDNWYPKCDDVSEALDTAICEKMLYLYELLGQDGVSLKMEKLIVIMTSKISFEYVKKAIQHMKDNDNWDPKCGDASEALKTAICKQKYDLYDLLVQDGVSLKMENLPGVIKESEIPFESLKKAIQHMKDTDNWDPKCGDASKALDTAICEKVYDVYDRLVQCGVSLELKNHLGVIMTSKISLEYVKKAIQHMKDTDSWDPKCGDASKALKTAICEQKYDVYDLLVQEGVSLKMENLPGVIGEYRVSLESVKKAIQHMKDNDNWDPKCDDASKSLETAIYKQKYDVYDLLIQYGVSLKMENFPGVTGGFMVSLKSVKKAIQHMKDTDNWDPKCGDASKALETAICEQKYDVSNLLVQNGISLKMENLPGVIRGFKISLEYVKKAIQHMKDTDNWDPKCGDASEALNFARHQEKYDVVDLLVKEGVLLNEESS
ncbi:hypothetical protein CHS0354_032780 [Potamilus streckersoni]|uniref:Novel STAND NTPase 3 domain-containing protein n=1 Tax=Potamilus streckersoni TaxID=2493646 RepID=A0AAE0VSN7_9BIVA|nr:hypothetical protein CHS0354_032780 [Potamilus streckersoni]